MAKKRDRDFEDFAEEVTDLFGARLDESVVRGVYDVLSRDLGYAPSGEDVEDYADVIFDYLEVTEEVVEEEMGGGWFVDEDVEAELAAQELRDRDRGADYEFEEGEEIELSIDTAYGEE